MNDFSANPVPQTPAPAGDHPNYNFDKSQQAFVDHVEDAPTLGYHFSPTALFALLAAGLVLIGLVISWMFVATQNSALNTKTQEIDTANAQIAGPLKQTNDLAVQFTQGLKAYSAIKTEQRNFNPLWDDLRKHIVPNTRFKTLAIDDKNSIKIDGEAKTFPDISRLIVSLGKSPSLKNITVGSTNSNDKTVDFSLTAQFVPVAVSSPATTSTNPVTTPTSTTQGAL